MKKSFSAVIWGLIAVLIWSAIPAFVKIGSDCENLPFLLVCRFLIASIIFFSYLKIILRKLHLISFSRWLALGIVLGANYYFQGLAMIELPVSWYLVIFCLSPILSFIFIGLNLNKKTLVSVGFSVLGTLLFVDFHEILKMPSLMPFFYISIGMLTWVAYTVMIKCFQTEFSNIETTAITQFISLFSCVLIWICAGFKIEALNSQESLSIVILGISTPIAYYGFNSCLRQVPRFSIISQYLEPVFGIIIGLLFFGESLSFVQGVGTSLIIIGTVLLES